MPDPSRLVTMPSLDDPSLAPDGCSTLFVLEPVPNLDGHGRLADRGRADAGAAARLPGRGRATPSDVVTEEFVTPLDWQAQGMAAGTPFALAHTFAQTGPFRPGNVEKQLPGLFFAGSGTVPGRRRADGADLGQARCAAGRALPADAGAMSRELRCCAAGLPGVRQADLAVRHHVLLGRRPAARGQRKHVYAVYALCRLADDIVDVPAAAGRTPDGRRSSGGCRPFADALPHRPGRAAQRRSGAGRGGPHGDRVRDRAGVLRPVLRGDGHGPDHELLRDLGGPLRLHGGLRRGDRGDDAAGPGADQPGRHRPGPALGLAFQLTNFLRDIDEDLDRGRVYVPQDDLRAFGVDLTARRATPSSGPGWPRDRAQPRSLRATPTRDRPAAAALGPLRGHRPGALRPDPGPDRAADYDVFARRVRVPTWRKAATAARIMVVGPPKPTGKPAEIERGKELSVAAHSH